MVLEVDANFWCTCLAVPVFEDIKTACRVLLLPGPVKRRHKIVTSHRLTVVTAEVLLHASLKRLFAKQGVHHADDFSAFLVNRGGVEITDFFKALGSDGMRHGPSIFGELGSTQHDDIVDALDCASAQRCSLIEPLGQHISGELLIAKHR